MKIIVLPFLLMFAAIFSVEAQTSTNKTGAVRTAQYPPPKTWTFKQGSTIDAWFVSFQGTNQIVVRKADYKDYSILISSLSVDDQAFLVDARAEILKSRLEAEVRQMQKQGEFELTVALMENFPEKVQQTNGCWMDAEFIKLDGRNLLSLTKGQERQDEQLSQIAGENFETKDWRDDFLGFEVKDKDGKTYSLCMASKRLPVSKVILNLKTGDLVRFNGYVSSMDIFGADKHDLWFFAKDAHVIKSSSEE